MTAFVSDAFRIQTREKLGGGASRALRREAMVPGVIYGANKDNVHLAVDPRDIAKGLNTSGFYSKIYELNINGKVERALVREIQFHPVTDRPIHIDFMRISKGAKIHLSIPVTFKNENLCPGIKQGGVLNVVLHSLEVTCDVDNIPEHIEVDLKDLHAGESIHTNQIKLGAGVVVTHPERDNTLATIIAPSSVDDYSASSENEEAAEA
jgi:large subunit ribosomal protein L25